MPEETEDVTITISNVPADLLSEIDAAARADGRNRSSFLRRELERLFREERRQQTASRPTASRPKSKAA